MGKKQREELIRYAATLMETHKPYVIGETKPCQHYNMSLSGYCNECHRVVRGQ